MRLALADLERHDPTAPPARGDERRFCCPSPTEPCVGKPIDASHRTLCLNVETGVWTCQRCHQSGKLGDEQGAVPYERAARQQLQRAFAVQAPAAPKAESDWRGALAGLVPLVGTRGQGWLDARAISWQAERAGVRYSPDWYGREAVVFPVRDRAGKLVAAQGRYLDAGKPKTRDAGAKAAGVFATPGAWEADPLVLCEGPADALSLATVGYPAVALMGCSASDIVAWSCAMRTVAVALDADEAGDQAAAKLMQALAARGCQVFRLRPPDGRDWNDELMTMGPEALGAELRAALEPPPDAAPQATAVVSESGSGSGRPAEETRQDFDFTRSTPEPVPEYTPEEQAEYDAQLREMAAVLPDRDLITMLREQWGCVLMLDGAGKLKAVGAENVPATVREEVRGRVAMLTAHLKRKG
jgi:phage/plasmid primase-like uncharacterized protein